MPERNPPVKYIQNFINNEFVDSVSKKTFPVLNPSTADKICAVAEGDKEDVDLAVKAAQAAFHHKSAWRTSDPSARARLLHKLSGLMERDADHIASLLTLENGKPFKNAIWEVNNAIKTLQYYAGWCDKIYGKTIPVDGPFFTMTLREPVGVVGQILPWNFPIALLAAKWGPALAAGCTTVLKPAEQTPLTILYITALTKEAGFPPGVINVVNGFGPTAGAAITSHRSIAKVAFVGSTEVGRIIMESAAKSNLKRVGLELGGKSPIAIFDDVDVDKAVDIAYEAVFINGGQTCCAATRTFVQDKIYDAFVKRAAERATRRTVGDPFDDVEQGPQIDEEMFTKALSMIEAGKKEGAKLEAGGSQLGDKGYFIQPTVFSNVTDDMKIAREEIFGPVQQILKFSTIEELVERANNTSYGLAAGIVTNDLNKALAFARAVQAGSVWVNCFNIVTYQAPFGGYKESGFGKDMGEEAIEDYLNIKTVTIALSQ
ncbi:aldehyde dehydrogenase 1A1-like [Macrosteles quadrilineatus]|uniref:aldehyde dehydrogenase 1A1-like n=1 Tax=Macrosteles quadrilineatus TaxID=74068 RepID=UPI0023E118BA|nr:aldehyde dehydrogenase 1A1-like [Macrosteles quadrilineatus]